MIPMNRFGLELKNFIENIVQRSIGYFGYKIIRNDPLVMSDEQFLSSYNLCKQFTMTSFEKIFALYKATEYVSQAKIVGDIVECGVWKGGSSMVIAKTMYDLHDTHRKIYLYDTYLGMAKPSEVDTLVGRIDVHARDIWSTQVDNNHNNWCYSPIQEVRRNMALTRYPKNKLVFVKGKVENTIPKVCPKNIALLRLDTDWYESTIHELNHLFNLVSPGGVIIVDDYGRWSGSKKAVDEFFSGNNINILLNRIDEEGRIGIKLH